MGRITEKFKSLKATGSKALIVYMTAGDPSLGKTEEIIKVLEDAGVDILEIGVPFSDPTADGPVIQAASQRALHAGTNLLAVLKMIKRVRKSSRIPIVLFGYYNPIYAFGLEKFAREAERSGVDAILTVDLPPEEAKELRRQTDRLKIDFISLIAPTTDDARLRKIVRRADGFLYYISITGVTGTTKPSKENIKKDMVRLRHASDLPVVVGFGISTPVQAAEIAPLADGIVIGSALVKLIAENGNNDNLHAIISTYIKNIKSYMISTS